MDDWLTERVKDDQYRATKERRTIKDEAQEEKETKDEGNRSKTGGIDG